jgi:cell division protein ZapA
MTDYKKINVLIDGRNFTIIGTEDERYVRELAEYVDVNIKKLSNRNEKLSPAMAATLAALNISDELFKTKNELKDLQKKSKEPLERYEGLKKEIEEYKKTIDELEKKNLEHKDEVIKTKMNLEELYKSVNLLKEELEEKNNKIKDLQKEVEEYKEKNFKAQVELVELKKQLTELQSLSKKK